MAVEELHAGLEDTLVLKRVFCYRSRNRREVGGPENRWSVQFKVIKCSEVVELKEEEEDRCPLFWILRWL
jgi:hypothetical protein